MLLLERPEDFDVVDRPPPVVAGIEQAEGFMHFFEGWIIFLLCVGVLFLMAIGLQQTRRNALPLRDAIDVEEDDFAALPDHLAHGAVGVLPRSACDGIPRLVNIVAHKAMLAAYGEGSAVIGRRHVRRAVADTESLGRANTGLQRVAAAILGTLSAAATAVGVFVLTAPV